jgi:serine/threonine-protein kinase HipA
VVNFFELVIFSFLTGNADMHLKNFSLIEQEGLGMVLSPAYDLLNTTLVNPTDDKELALNLNGKKKKLKMQDFVANMNNMHVEEKQQQNIFNKMLKALPAWEEQIELSIMSQDFKEKYKQILSERFRRIME